MTESWTPVPSNCYSGISDFTLKDGFHHRVVWRIRRANRKERSRGLNRGHLIFLEIRVDDQTTCLWDDGTWKRRVRIFGDRVTRPFYTMITEMYN